MKRKTSVDIRRMKGGAPIVSLTAYTAYMAKLLNEHTDLFIVGDSLGMVVYGMESTVPVTLDLMIAHGRAVSQASQIPCVVVDMPFGSYQASPAAAFDAAARILKETGCQAVKLEGGAEMAETVAFLAIRAIPVMGHVGLMPQHVRSLGGYPYQGKTKAERDKVLKDALAIEKAGAFAIVLEGVEESLAREVTHKLSVPTIGIGASPACDGQVLVTEDMLALTPAQPRFVKHYGDAGTLVSKAAEAYAKDVRARKFPAQAHCFTNKK